MILLADSASGKGDCNHGSETGSNILANRRSDARIAADACFGKLGVRHRYAGAAPGLHARRLSAVCGEIPNVRAITACLRRQKPSLSEACRAVFEQ